MILTTNAADRWRHWMQRDLSPTTAHSFAAIVDGFIRDVKLASKKVDSIDDDIIHAWVNKEDDTKLATKRFRLAALRSYFKFCTEKGHCRGNPANLVRVRIKGLKLDQLEKEPKRVFTDDEIARVFNHLNYRIHECHITNRKKVKDKLNQWLFWHCAVTLGSKTGLRLGDVAQLQWDSIKDESLVVWTDKTETRVELPLDRMMRVALMAEIPKTDERFCWPEQNRIINSTKRCLLSKQFERILDACHIEGVTFHCLRHTYATACHAAGIPTPHIREALGHASEAMTRRYIHE